MENPKGNEGRELLKAFYAAHGVDIIEQLGLDPDIEEESDPTKTHTPDLPESEGHETFEAFYAAHGVNIRELLGMDSNIEE